MYFGAFIADFSAFFFLFHDTATTEIYTLSLHDALPISRRSQRCRELLITARLPALHGRQLPAPWRENRTWLGVPPIGVPFPCPAMQARLRIAASTVARTRRGPARGEGGSPSPGR